MSYMTDGLTFNVLRNANMARRERTKKFSQDWSTAQWMQALIGEVGELANILKKIDRRDFTIQSKRLEIANELADIQTYLDLLAAKCGVNLGNATIAKFNEVSNRVGSDVKIYADGSDWKIDRSE